MNYIVAYEATRLSELIARVAQGERITITKEGAPVAVIQPIARSATKPIRETITQLREFRKSHHLNGMTIREMIDNGRR